MATSLNYSKSKIILITGKPGLGKTTIVKKLHEKLCQNEKLKHCLRGFYTEEVRNNLNERIGFDVIDFNEKSKAFLARSVFVKFWQIYSQSFARQVKSLVFFKFS